MYWRKGKTSDGEISPEERFLLERYVHVRRGVFVWLLTMAFLSPFLMSAAGFWYTNHVRHQMEAQWCTAMRYELANEDPVQKPVAEKVLRDIQKRQRLYGCEKK